MGLLQDMSGLLFPEACSVCGIETQKSERCLCHACRMELPVILSDPLASYPPFARKFEGLLPLQNAFSFLKFGEGRGTRQILHALKYGQRPELAWLLGYMLAEELLERELIVVPDIIIPVPMHKAKEADRGYNQAMVFAQGLAEKLACQPSDKILLKKRVTETQTRKNKLARIMNMKEVFVLDVERKSDLRDKNIWLVDDVVTTGSTMLASGTLLAAEPIRSLSMVTIAMA